MKNLMTSRKLAFIQLLIAGTHFVLYILQLIFFDVKNNGWNVKWWNFTGGVALTLVNICVLVIGILAMVVAGYQIYVALKMENDKTIKWIGMTAGICLLLPLIPFLGAASFAGLVLNLLIYLNVFKSSTPSAPAA